MKILHNGKKMGQLKYLSVLLVWLVCISGCQRQGRSAPSVSIYIIESSDGNRVSVAIDTAKEELVGVGEKEMRTWVTNPRETLTFGELVDGISLIGVRLQGPKGELLEAAVGWENSERSRVRIIVKNQFVTSVRAMSRRTGRDCFLQKLPAGNHTLVLDANQLQFRAGETRGPGRAMTTFPAMDEVGQKGHSPNTP